MTRWAWLICFFVLLGGCTETTPTKPEPKPQLVKPAKPTWSAEETALFRLPVRKRVGKAIQLLEQGKTELARALLDSVLKDQPNNRTAKRLIAQLDADPEEMLGKAAYTYRVRPGDSLSIIAKRLLNDPLKFVILARYNGIENPSQLTTGQRLRIPGKPPAAVPAAAPKQNKAAAETSASANTEESESATTARVEPQSTEPAAPAPAAATDKLAAAQQLIDAGNLAVAISTLEPLVAAEPGNDEARAMLVRAYREQAQRKTRAGQLHQAKDLLEKALVLAPTDDDLLTQLTNVEDQLEARSLYETGKSLAANGNYAQAYEALSQALIYDPELSDAAALQNQIKPKLVEQYHRKAMNLFREQRLDAAIKYWDKVLELDPANTLAPGYRARALELKQKLRHLGQ